MKNSKQLLKIYVSKTHWDNTQIDDPYKQYIWQNETESSILKPPTGYTHNINRVSKILLKEIHLNFFEDLLEKSPDTLSRTYLEILLKDPQIFLEFPY
jgi:hypothetical protein